MNRPADTAGCLLGNRLLLAQSRHAQ